MSFSHGVVVTGASEAPVSCLLGEGRLILPSLSEAVGNSSAESPIMVCGGDGGPLQSAPMMMYLACCAVVMSRMSFSHGVVVTGASESPVSRLLGEGRSILPPLSEDVGNSSTGSPIMVRSGDGGPLQAEPMMMASKTSPEGERLRTPKQSVMNSRLQK
jgi:hypothetical protein